MFVNWLSCSETVNVLWAEKPAEAFPVFCWPLLSVWPVSTELLKTDFGSRTICWEDAAPLTEIS